jgi:hypothetical protein
MTYEEHLLLLSSEISSERAVAGLVLSRSGIASHRDAVRTMILNEQHFVVVMSLAPTVVGWHDDTLDTLLTSNLDDRPLFALVESARFQKRLLREEQVQALMEHVSIFVRLATIQYASVFGPMIDFRERIDQPRKDARSDNFVARSNQPSPIFSNRAK